MTAFVAVLVPVYWREYGPGNFLWFSDIALFAVLFSLWTGNRLVFSMMAIGVLPLELAWTIDFLTGGNLLGMAAYMFDSSLSLHLRGLSLFHLAIPPLLVWMLVRQGYDRRALFAQTLFAWAVILATRLLTSREDNINWVYGFGAEAQNFMPGPIYLAAYMLLLPVVCFIPMHLLLRRLFPAGQRERLPTPEPSSRG